MQGQSSFLSPPPPKKKIIITVPNMGGRIAIPDFFFFFSILFEYFESVFIWALIGSEPAEQYSFPPQNSHYISTVLHSSAHYSFHQHNTFHHLEGDWRVTVSWQEIEGSVQAVNGRLNICGRQSSP